MAKTYFEYAEREPGSQVDWFKVGKEITDSLKKVDEDREKRKAAVDEAFRKDINELANAPQGNSDIVNKWTTDYSAEATDYLLMINRLLKSGGIKPKDYTLIKQNLKDGTGILFNLSKEYQAEYEDKMKRAQPNGGGSAVEAQIMAMVEGFANIKDTKAVINPLTGAVSVGRTKVGPDGIRVLEEGADNNMTVNQLRNHIKQKINKYELVDDLQGDVKVMGDVVTEMVTKTGSSTETGFITKITDPTKRKGLSQEGQQAADAYMQIEKDIVNSKLANPYNISSVLYDWARGIDPNTNKPYQVVFDKNLAETSSHYVLYSYKNGVLQPDFESTKNGQIQKTQAEDYVTNKLRSMLEQKSEIQPFQQPRKEYAPQYVVEAGAKAKEDRTAGNMIAKLYSGTPAEQQSAVTYFGGLPNVRSVKRNDDGVTVTFLDGVVKEIPFKNPANNQLMTQDDFVRSASSLLIGKNVDINNVLRGAIGTGSTQFTPGTAGVEAQVNKPSEIFGNFVNTSISTVSQDEESAVKELAPTLQKIGFTIRAPYDPTGEYIRIKNKDGVESEKIDLESADAADQIKAFILSNVPGKDQVEQAMFISDLIKRGAISAQQAKPAQQNKSGVGSKYN